VQRSSRVHLAAGHHGGGPGERIHGQQRIGGGCGQQLGVRRGSKQPSLIQPIKRLAIERGDADAELRMAQRRLGQDRIDPVCEGRFGRNGMRRLLAMNSRLRERPRAGSQRRKQYIS